MRPLNRLVVAALVIAPVPGRAGEFAQAPPVPGMALSLPDPGMASGAPEPASLPAPSPVPTTDPPAPARAEAGSADGRRLRALGSGFSAVEGQLPNQRTGSRHQHVVRDICIGC